MGGAITILENRRARTRLPDNDRWSPLSRRHASGATAV